MHNGTKVNTKSAEKTLQAAKSDLFARKHVGVIETPYGAQLINSGDAIDHAYMRGRQLSSLLRLIQGDSSERFRNLLPVNQDSLLWMAVELADEVEAMIDMIVVDVKEGHV